MARERIITALDLGSHRVRVGVILIKSPEDIKVAGYGESASRGLRRGQIIDLNEAVECIKEAVSVASKSANVKISKVSVGASGPHFKLSTAKGAIAVSRANGEISRDDVIRVLETAKQNAVLPNREVVHALPVEYKIDTDEKVKDPVGMRGIRLEVEANLILGSTPVLRLIRRATQEAGLELENIVYGPLAASSAVLTKKQKELGVAVLDIGGTTTSLALWEESDLKYTSVLPVGSNHISNDMAIGLRITPDLSEKIKTEYGSCLAGSVSRREQVVMAGWGGTDFVVPKWEVARIIEARVGEIFDLVAGELKSSGRIQFLPAGVVISGGGSRLEGVLDVARKKLKLPVELARVRDIKSDFGEFFNPASATLAGLMLYELEREQSGEQKVRVSETIQTATTILAKIKSWFYDLIP